jgi:peptidoglycan/LPS O-acetylase OafA/YrhL
MGYSIGGSWYISAMLLAMLVLYPLRRKKPEFFDYVIAPVITLLFVGYIYHLGSGISRTITYIPDLHILDGMFRAIAEISLGCFCYRMGTRLMQVNFTWIGQLLLSIIELGGYLLVGFTVWEHSGSDKDLVLLVILAVCVTLSFSGKGIHARLCTNRLFPFLGQFSLSIYLSHGVVVNVIVPYLYKQNLPEYISKTSKTAYFTLYLGITLLLSIGYYLIGTLVQKTFPKIKQSLKKLLIKQA